MIGVVSALGVTQILGYGTLYYAFAILAPTIAREFATDQATLFAIFSAGLLLAGLAAPALGRWMDRHGPPAIMALGSLAVSLALVGIGLAPNLIWFGILLLAQMIIAAAVQYEAAFAALAYFAGANARRAITHLTLFGAVASTIFWPVTGWLATEIGWRTTWFVYAFAHLAIAFPLHLWLWRHGRRAQDARRVAAATTPLRESTPLTGADARFAFAAIASGFALSGTVVAALGVHMVLILQALGLGTAAYTASMIMGPMQAVIRLTDAIFFQRLHPLSVAIISGLAVPGAVMILFAGAHPTLAGMLFAGLFGISQGLSSIVKGSVPLVLFGTAGFAERLGRLTAIRAIPSAAAPFVFAVLHENSGITVSLVLLAGIGALGALPLIVLRQRLDKCG
jgi:MFS family permease